MHPAANSRRGLIASARFVAAVRSVPATKPACTAIVSHALALSPDGELARDSRSGGRRRKPQRHPQQFSSSNAEEHAAGHLCVYHERDRLSYARLRMDIPFIKHTLSNGLDVLIHEDHACPIVAVNVWYHVGSKNEVPGRTGFAHLFEHLMFEGSQHYDHGYFQPLQEAGAPLNGSTNADRTNYWEVVPTNALELALWMESDRMGYLLPALTDAKFENQRDVVLNERRQNYENRPYGFAGMAHRGGALSAGPSVPLDDDRRPPRTSAPRILDDVRRFSRRYYRPRNASLALAGRRRHRRGARAGGRSTSASSAGHEPPRGSHAVRRDVASERSVRLLLEDRVELPRLYMAWHSPALFADGDAELDLVADVLASGKTSRLYRTLGYEQRMATEIAASQNSRELGGFFQIVATAAPGRTLAELERAIAHELDALDRRTGRRAAKWSDARRRRRPISSTGCRPSADLAASPIS